MVPITTSGYSARRRGFTVSLEDAETRTRGFISCDQPRVLDLRARNGRLLETAPADTVQEVLARLRAILG